LFIEVQRDFIPHSILIPISSTECRSHTPPTPLRNDIELPIRTTTDRIYLNQIQEIHQYASIDLDEDDKVIFIRKNFLTSKKQITTFLF